MQLTSALHAVGKTAGWGKKVFVVSAKTGADGLNDMLATRARQVLCVLTVSESVHPPREG